MKESLIIAMNMILDRVCLEIHRAKMEKIVEEIENLYGYHEFDDIL